MVLPPKVAHPEDDSPKSASKPENPSLQVDTFGGKIHVEWEPGAAVTPMGQLAFFIQFLKTGYRFEPWVEDCPLIYKSNNAPSKTDVLGSFLLSILSGHNRYAHMTTLIGDGVNSRLLGMKKVVSDDSARRALKRIDEEEGVVWLQHHLQECYEPLLRFPWVMDVDVTVKPLYGHQEGAVKGYNPHKKGRPSHTYHSYMMANLKLVLEVEVQPGNQSSSAYSLPGLVELLGRLPQDCWPEFVRGDCDWGSDPVMSELETLGCHYLFKIKKSSAVRRLIHKAHCSGGWVRYNKDWEGKETELKLGSWRQSRRAIVVRRRLPDNASLLLEKKTEDGQQTLALLTGDDDIKAYEYSVLVTSLDDDIISLINHYRNRADCENSFDEIKNQWGWGGYTTRDMKRCRLIARMVALIYNGWTLFVRMSNPDSHKESITSRPLLMSAVGKLTESGRQKKLAVSSQHGLMRKVQKLQAEVSEFLNKLRAIAPQLNPVNIWCHILTRAVSKILNGAPVLAEVGPTNTS